MSKMNVIWRIYRLGRRNEVQELGFVKARSDNLDFIGRDVSLGDLACDVVKGSKDQEGEQR